jgi:plasmid stability protein
LSLGSSSLVPFCLSRVGFCVYRRDGSDHDRSRRPKSGIPKSCSIAINVINDIIDGMASIIIRKLPESTKRRLRIRAARNGHSMEQEARELLETGLARADSEPENLGDAIRRRFAPLGGVDLKIPPRRGTIREIQFK